MITNVWLVVCLLSISTPVFAQDDILKKSIFFGGGSYYVDDVQRDELQDFIQSVDRIQNYEVIIFSHTDNIGGKEYNAWLSQMRSEAVEQQLHQFDVPEELIKIRDFGLTNPLYTNTSHDGRIMNRRVDVILWPIVF